MYFPLQNDEGSSLMNRDNLATNGMNESDDPWSYSISITWLSDDLEDPIAKTKNISYIRNLSFFATTYVSTDGSK